MTPTTASAITVNGSGRIPDELAQDVRAFAAASRAPATRRAYRRAFAAWARWAAEHGTPALPADPRAVAVYLAERARHGRSVATIEQDAAAIAQAHQVAGIESPRRSARVRAVLAGIRRTIGSAPRQARAVSVPELRAMLATCGDDAAGARDRALLLIGFAAALRRSELVGLDAADVQITDDGAVVTIRRSKTDQDGQGRQIGVPFGSSPATCPVRALRAWLAVGAIASGPIFRPINRHGQIAQGRLSDRAVARIVQRAGAAAGIERAQLSGHSLRAGFATAAARLGKSERAIMRQTGHRSVVVARRYIRAGSLFADNAAAGVL